MKETKSIQIHPSEENFQIDLWGKFGWEVKSSQEIFNRDSRDLGDKVETVTTNYVKLVFSRETTMPNYQKIKSLENEYDQKANRLQVLKNDEPTVNIIITVVLLFIYIIPGVIYLVVKSNKKKKYKEEVIPQIITLQNDLERILNESQRLVV